MKGNESRPDWYDAAKGGLGGSPFTEEMKQNVLRKVGEPPRRGRSLHWAAGVAIAALGIAAFALLSPLRSGEPPVAPAVTDVPASPPVSPPATNDPQPSPETSLPPDEPPTAAEQEVRLVYENPEGSLGNYPVELDRLEATRIRTDSIEVKRVIDVDGLGKFYVYLKNRDDTELYVGMEAISGERGKSPKDELYEIGQIGAIGYVDDFEITKSNLFGSFHLRIFGICGANCVSNNWIRFEEANPGVPVSVFRLYAHVREIDLDDDGVPEVVASETSTIAKAQIYKKFGEEIKFVDVNAALRAEHPHSVVYEMWGNVFKAIYPDRTLEYQYRIGEDVLVLTRDTSADSGTERLLQGGLYDGGNSIRFEFDGTPYDAAWVKEPFREFGLYLPSMVRTVVFEDGHEYEALNGKGSIHFVDKDALPQLWIEPDLKRYADYLGSEYWGDNRDIRYDYFEYAYDDEHRAYIAIRYSLESGGKLRPLLLATASTVRYAPER